MPPTRRRSRAKAMAAVYAGWGFSEPFYRQELFRAFGAADPDEFIELFWDHVLPEVRRQ